MSMFRMMLLGTVAVGLTVAAMSSASAGEVEKSFGISGHVNRVMAVGDDGKDSFLLHSDNEISRSRARFQTTAKSESLTVGATIELSLSAGNSSSQHASGADTFDIRHSFISLSNNMGTIRMGDTGHAGNGHTGIDVSSTGHAEAMADTPIDGVLIHASGSTASAAGSSIVTILGSNMTQGRDSGVSYDTPEINGFGLTVSHYNLGSGGIEGRHRANYDGVQVSTSAGFVQPGTDTTDNLVGGGIGIKLVNGLSISANYAATNLNSTVNTTNRPDPETFYGKIGYGLSVSDTGTTGLAVSYRQTDDLTNSGDNFTAYSFLVEQSLSDYGTSIYGGVTSVSYDTTATNFDDVTAGWIGAKVVFLG